MVTGQTQVHYSVPSVIAIAAAIGSLFSGAMWGFILALIAIVFGIIGFMLSLSPSRRGGVVSLFSIVVAGIGIVVALFRLLGKVF